MFNEYMFRWLMVILGSVSGITACVVYAEEWPEGILYPFMLIGGFCGLMGMVWGLIAFTLADPIRMNFDREHIRYFQVLLVSSVVIIGSLFAGESFAHINTSFSIAHMAHILLSFAVCYVVLALFPPRGIIDSSSHPETFLAFHRQVSKISVVLGVSTLAASTAYESVLLTRADAHISTVVNYTQSLFPLIIMLILLGAFGLLSQYIYAPYPSPDTTQTPEIRTPRH